MIVTKKNSLKGTLTIPGDKSISHRAIMLGALAEGTTEIEGFLNSADCLSTIACFRQMGVEVRNENNLILVKGQGLAGLKQPEHTLDVGNSGTTMRLMSGILAAQSFFVSVTGDDSIKKRPMKRIITPLSMMGADIESLNQNDCAPLKIIGSPLNGIHYESPVASAQVKSAVLLAGLWAKGKTSVTEPCISRNHTELMLQYFGVPVESDGNTATVTPMAEHSSHGRIQMIHNLYSRKVTVPGDISSAAYFIAVGLIIPNSEIVVKNVGINPTRNGILKICGQMGANIKLENICNSNGEPTADLVIKSSSLNGTVIGGDIIPALIDELPVIAVIAAFAEGTTIIKDAAELKVKESNRIDVMVHNLTQMGADVTATEDGMIIRGGKPLHGAVIDSHSDHRIAMSFAIAGLAADGETEIKGSDCVQISYPEFFNDLERLYQ